MSLSVGRQVSPLPGNPTPPMTPGGAATFYQSPTALPADHNPPLCESVAAPPPVMADDGARLTLLARAAPIMPPFRLEHNYSVSKFMFTLSHHDYSQLMARWKHRQTDTDTQIYIPYRHADSHTHTHTHTPV